MVKNPIYLIQIVLAFAAGWYLHGLIMVKPEIAQQSVPEFSAVVTEEKPEDLNLSAHEISAALAEPNLLANQIIELVDAGKLNEALLLSQNKRIVFTPNQLEQYENLLVNFFTDKSPGEYYRQPGLRGLVSVLFNLNQYSPAAQYFNVIRLTGDEPFLALASLDELASYYQEQVSQTHLQVLENWLLAEVELSLLNQQDWSGLQAWYEALLARSQEPLEIYDQMARVFAAADRPFESSRALENIARVSGLNDAQLMLQKNNLAVIESTAIASVQMVKAGQHFIAPVMINAEISARLLVDTGASISSLDQAYSNRVGLSASGEKILLGTAGGQVEADLISLRSMGLGESLVYDLKVARIDLGGRHEGLLGMDVLGQFEFFIDQQKSILYLRRPSQYAETLFIQ